MKDLTTILAPILAEREAHLARLPLTDLGRSVVMDALREAPVRSPKGGPANVTRASFRKSPVTNDTESVTFEFEDLFRLEADPAVIDYRTQALVVKVSSSTSRSPRRSASRGSASPPTSSSSSTTAWSFAT